MMQFLVERGRTMRRLAVITIMALVPLVADRSVAAASGGTILVSPIPPWGQVIVGQSTSHGFQIGLVSSQSPPVTITGLVIGGTDPGDFSVVGDGCTGVTLQPFGPISCNAGVAFAPTALGSRSATLSISSDAQVSPVVLPLGGVGGPLPQLCILPAGTVDFGRVFVGGTPDVEGLHLANCGLADLHITNVTIGGDSDFSLIGNGCVGTTIPPSGSCAASIQFAPTIDGAASATLTVESDSFDGSHSAPLVGTGVADTDLGITALADPDPVQTHHGLDYTITVTNFGPLVEPGGSDMSFFLYDGQGFIDVKPSAGCLAPAVGGSGGLLCPFGPLAVGASVTLKIDVNVTAKPKGAVGGLASMVSAISDLNSANDFMNLVVPVT